MLLSKELEVKAAQQEAEEVRVQLVDRESIIRCLEQNDAKIRQELGLMQAKIQSMVMKEAHMELIAHC